MHRKQELITCFSAQDILKLRREASIRIGSAKHAFFPAKRTGPLCQIQCGRHALSSPGSYVVRQRSLVEIVFHSRARSRKERSVIMQPAGS